MKRTYLCNWSHRGNIPLRHIWIVILPFQWHKMLWNCRPKDWSSKTIATVLIVRNERSLIKFDLNIYPWVHLVVADCESHVNELKDEEKTQQLLSQVQRRRDITQKSKIIISKVSNNINNNESLIPYNGSNTQCINGQNAKISNKLASIWIQTVHPIRNSAEYKTLNH